MITLVATDGEFRRSVSLFRPLPISTAMADFLQRIIPMPQPDVAEIFRVYQATHDFYREVEQREALEEYCQWYYQVAEQHQQELEAMRGDINVLGWFCRSK
jgi:hypothetical protein